MSAVNPQTIWNHTLQEKLLELFKEYDAQVAVGVMEDGIVIRSQDPRVNAKNVGNVQPYDPV